MAVTSSQTASRVLKVTEAIGIHQPIGIRALARLLECDKSAIHRAVTTLANEGWIRPSREQPSRWELSPRILAIADHAFGGYNLKRRAHAALQRLRDVTGETVVLIILEDNNLLVVDVVESNRMLRWVPPVGTVAPPERSAAGRALIPYLEPRNQVEVLGKEVDADLREVYAEVRTRGYSISDRETSPVSASVGCAIFGLDDRPVGVITVIGPSERIAAAGHDRIGQLVMEAAQSLSQGGPRYP